MVKVQRMCKKCKYIWMCSSKLIYFCCPSCMTKARHQAVTI